MNTTFYQFANTKEKRKTYAIAHYLFLFFISIYLLTSSHSTVYETDASNARYQVTKSLVEHFDVCIPSGTGVQGIDGRDYSWFGLGYSLLAVPFYIIGKLISIPENAVPIMDLLLGATTAVLIFLFCITLGYSNRISALVSIFYGIGTFAWPLAKQPFDHTMETFLVLLTVYLTYLYTLHKKTSHLIFSAVAFGFALLTRATSILVLPAVIIFIVINFSKKPSFKMAFGRIMRTILFFSMYLLPFILLNFFYNYYRFGSIFETGYTLISAKTGLNFFFGTPLITGLTGFLISPGKGFFYYSPIAILFLFSIKNFTKRHTALSISFLLIIISYLFFLSRNIYWHGDWAWGPRYLLVLTPFFVIPIAEFLDSQKVRTTYFLKLIICNLFCVSLLIQLAAVSVHFQRYFAHLIFEEHIKFNVSTGDGVQRITEPPLGIYFDLRYSPIIAQFSFFYASGKKMKDILVSHNKGVLQDNQAGQYQDIFDFWWLYRYFTLKSHTGFLVALILFFLSMYALSQFGKIAFLSKEHD